MFDTLRARREVKLSSIIEVKHRNLEILYYVILNKIFRKYEIKIYSAKTQSIIKMNFTILNRYINMTL